MPRTRSLTMPAEIPTRTSSVSPGRMRRHSRAPSGVSGMGHSLDDSVAEVDDEEALGIEAAMDRVEAYYSDAPVISSQQDDDEEDSEYDVPQTPHVRPDSHLIEPPPTLEGDPEVLLLQQPPELSSSLSSSGRTSNTPDTPPSSFARQSPISRPAQMTRSASASHSAIHSRSPSGVVPDSPPAMVRSQTSIAPDRGNTTPQPVTSGVKKGGIWKKMKAVTLSSTKGQNGASGAGLNDRKTSFSGGARALLERTTSRTAAPASKVVK